MRRLPFAAFDGRFPVELYRNAGALPCCALSSAWRIALLRKLRAVVTAKKRSLALASGRSLRSSAMYCVRSRPCVKGASRSGNCSHVIANADGSRPPISSVVSSLVVPTSKGTCADAGGASGSNGWRGSERPSSTGPKFTPAVGVRLFSASTIFCSGSVRSSLTCSGASPSACRNVLAPAVAVSSRLRADHRAALHHRLVKESLRRRHGHQRTDFGAAAGLAEDEHVVRIAAEFGDVVAHPLQRQQHVEIADIARVCERGRRSGRRGRDNRARSGGG